MPHELIIIGAVAAVISLITVILGLIRELNQWTIRQPRSEAVIDESLRLLAPLYCLVLRAVLFPMKESSVTHRIQRAIHALVWDRLLNPLVMILATLIIMSLPVLRSILTGHQQRDSWFLRLTRQSLPPSLREFADEMRDDREDALAYDATHPNASHPWSDKRETRSLMIKIFKHRILSIRRTTHTVRLSGTAPGTSAGTGSVTIRPPLLSATGEVFSPVVTPEPPDQISARDNA